VQPDNVTIIILWEIFSMQQRLVISKYNTQKIKGTKVDLPALLTLLRVEIIIEIP